MVYYVSIGHSGRHYRLACTLLTPGQVADLFASRVKGGVVGVVRFICCCIFWAVGGWEMRVRDEIFHLLSFCVRFVWVIPFETKGGFFPGRGSKRVGGILFPFSFR